MLLFFFFSFLCYFFLFFFLHRENTHIYKPYFLKHSMNITRARQNERIKKIAQMKESIKQSAEPDFNKLIMVVCAEWGISERTAKEYLKVARFQIENGI